MMEWVVERLIALLGPIGTLSKDRRDLKDNALRSISNALLETKLYYRDLGRGQVRNIETETQLSRYWAAAAIPLRHFDQELAAACENKGHYWLNPEAFTPEEIRRMGIRLEDVSLAYRKLVGRKFSQKLREADH